MDAGVKTLREVFKNDTLIRIPFYQRRYVWNEDTDHNWSRFCDDLESTMDSTRSYFLGSLILKHEDVRLEDRRIEISKRCELVDGQQRLTTLAIYMKLLHMMTNAADDYNFYYRIKNASKDSVIQHNCEDRPAFNKIIGLDVPVDDLGIKENQITKAYEYFYKRFNELRAKGVSLNDLRVAIYAALKFVVIELKDDDDEQQIFDTINSLGVDLTTDELLKNYLYKAKDKDEYRNWRDMFDTDTAKKFWETDAAKSRQESMKGNRAIDRFFHAFVRVKMWDFSNQLTDEQKKQFVKVSNVYSTCKAFVEDFGMDRIALANEIIAYAKIYKDNFTKEVLDERIPMYPCVKRIACITVASGAYSVLPYMLFVIKNVADQQEVNKICGVLERYIMRRKLANSDDKMYSDLFTENLIGGQDCRDADALYKYLSTRDSALAIPTNGEIITNMLIKPYKEDTAKLVYYMYETSLTPDDNTQFKGGYNDYEAKQLMPKPGKVADANWTPLPDVADEENRKVAIATIGNFFMLEGIVAREYRKNEKQAFATKLAVMRRWIANVACSGHLNTITSWEVDDINNRTTSFANNFVTNIWVK